MDYKGNNILDKTEESSEGEVTGQRTEVGIVRLESGVYDDHPRGTDVHP